jgi:type I restriction enzyme R subunit
MSGEFQSEAELENQFMRRLNALGYKTITINDEEHFIEHFRTILNDRNRERLKGSKLTDAEFNRALNAIIGSKSIYDIAQILRGSDVQPYGKIVIERDDNTEVYLEFFDGNNFENNIYEVTHQVTVNGKHENRYDVTVLINGMPIVQAELKKRGVDFTEAFNQIVRYRDESYRQLFRLVQIFVISNGGDTRYFANGDGALNSNFMFYWTDEKNNWLNDLDAFTSSFFKRERLHSMIAKYTIFDDDHQRMIIMRPYQVFATEAIVNQAKNHPEKNGYIWHTTGSGKTITSFKTSQILARETDAEKIIFMIDRSDLDIQTAKNFNSYLPNTAGNEPALDQTDSTFKLVEQLKSSDSPLIITTIQKLNHAISNDRYKDILTKYHDKKVIFIEDEAHRSQFGEMRKNVNHWFNNAQHFGFTGTPIFADNVGPDGRTTETLYDEQLHQYLIKDAIRDKNVLGFSIQYINTIKGKETIEDADEKVAGIDTKEVMEADDRLRKVVEHIRFNHDALTNKHQYNAILTVPSTEVALKYYKIFKEVDPKQQLKVTTIFTWAANEDTNEKHQNEAELTSRHGLDKVIDDYNATYNTSFSTENFKDYFADVSKRMKEHNGSTPEDNIDVLIVVNMFLTGFDSPKLSTLYVDKRLQYHGLIQAFSRTNRVEKESKPFGNIVAYRNIKSNTDDAVRLFSAGSQEAFFVPEYEELKEQFDIAINELHQITPTAQDVDQLYNLGDDELKKFVLAFRSVLQVHNKIRVYDDFDWDKMKDLFTKQEMEDFRGKYFEVYHHLHDDQDRLDKESVLNDIDFELDLLAVDKIDVQYIVNLITTISLDSEANMNADRNKIKRLLENADNPQLKLKSELLAEFLDEVVPHLEATDNVNDELNRYLERKREASIDDFSDEIKVSKNVINEQFSNYEFYGNPDNRKLTQSLNEAGYGFKEKITLKKRVVNFIKETAEKYKVMN